MFKCLLLLLSAIAITGCSATNPTKPESNSTSPVADSYGYKQEDPIKVGAFVAEPRPHFNSNLRDYLARLRGPDGQKVASERLGSCCHVDSPAAPYGKAPLDRYQLTYPGLEKPITIYINAYDYEQPRAPEGFTLAD